MAYKSAKGLQEEGISATVKHYVSQRSLVYSFIGYFKKAAFVTPERSINTAPVHGGERELRSLYLQHSR